MSMRNDGVVAQENAHVEAMPATHDGLIWRCNWTLHKFGDQGDKIARALKAGAPVSDFQHAWEEPPIVREGNLLMYGGASCLWQFLLGNGTTTAGQALTYFNNSRAAIGSGDSNTAAAATQTDLQASTNLLRVAMDATYPTHTDATTSGAATITFRSTFGTSQGNYAWQEWGVFNSATAATGRMLNRRVESLGTKTSAATWTFTVTITLA